jgi:hypothetical protein
MKTVYLLPVSILFVFFLVILLHVMKYKEHFIAKQTTILNPYDSLSVSGLDTNNPPKEVDDRLFVFANNKSDPRCCLNEYNSGYSNSRGCICLTDQQKQYLTKSILSKKC